jgi:hypothetical protein
VLLAVELPQGLGVAPPAAPRAGGDSGAVVRIRFPIHRLQVDLDRSPPELELPPGDARRVRDEKVGARLGQAAKRVRPLRVVPPRPRGSPAGRSKRPCSPLAAPPQDFPDRHCTQTRGVPAPSHHSTREPTSPACSLIRSPSIVPDRRSRRSCPWASRGQTKVRTPIASVISGFGRAWSIPGSVHVRDLRHSPG